jgi:putative membrane protein
MLLLGLFAILWIALAILPADRSDWLLGNVREAQQDIAPASFGAPACLCVAATVNMSGQRDFTGEWSDSLRVKDPGPPGEEAIRRMRQSGT